MNAKLPQLLCLIAVGLLLSIPTFGQSPNDFVEKVKMGTNTLTIETDGRFQHFALEIVGPNDFFLKKELNNVTDIVIDRKEIMDKDFESGRYQLQITPSILLSQQEQKRLRYLMATEQLEKVAAAKALHQIPEKLDKYTWHFSIENHAFVLPKHEASGLKLLSEAPQKSLSALKLAPAIPQATFTSLLNEPKPQFVDQVFVDDMIIDGSLCVGQDCVNGESFGFDTGRFKENNLRIHFNDTSASASFPSNDWRISINDSTNGGSSFFGIDDATAGIRPFQIQAGAQNNAFMIAASSNVGFGTSTPSKTIHVANNDTPTLRLEQDGAGGFSPQTWDIGGNEANFFIKDVSNSSAIPFKIAIGAPANSFCIAADGNITTAGTINGSDKRLKKEIAALDKMLPIIQQLQPKQYYYRPEFGLSKNLQFGLIAQEVEMLFPHLVSNINQTTADGEKMKGINYTALVPVLIKGIQEQQQVIDSQEDRILDLENQLTAMKSLKAEVAALAQLVKGQASTEKNEQVGAEK